MEGFSVAGVVQGLLTVLLIVLWSMFTDMKKQLKDTQKEVSDYKQYVAEKYATADELRSALESVKELLLRLDDKIDDIRSQGRRHD